MSLKEAVAILSEFGHRGIETWIISKSTSFHRGELQEKNVFVIPDPEEAQGASVVLTEFEAIAVASALQRTYAEMQLAEGDARKG